MALPLLRVLYSPSLILVAHSRYVMCCWLLRILLFCVMVLPRHHCHAFLSPSLVIVLLLSEGILTCSFPLSLTMTCFLLLSCSCIDAVLFIPSHRQRKSPLLVQLAHITHLTSPFRNFPSSVPHARHNTSYQLFRAILFTPCHFRGKNVCYTCKHPFNILSLGKTAVPSLFRPSKTLPYYRHLACLC